MNKFDLKKYLANNPLLKEESTSTNPLAQAFYSGTSLSKDQVKNYFYDLVKGNGYENPEDLKYDLNWGRAMGWWEDKEIYPQLVNQLISQCENGETECDYPLIQNIINNPNNREEGDIKFGNIYITTEDGSNIFDFFVGGSGGNYPLTNYPKISDWEFTNGSWDENGKDFDEMVETIHFWLDPADAKDWNDLPVKGKLGVED